MDQAAAGLGRRAVVADDEPQIRDLLSDLLRREGFVVTEAATGPQALEQLRSSRVDMLISDIMMPGMDGLAVVKVAREVSPHTASIIITGEASVERARSATQGGAYDFLPKPFSQGELMGAVRRALARKMAEEDQARERELADLFQLSEVAKETTDARQFLQLTLSAAAAQTRSDLGWAAGAEDGEMRLLATVPQDQNSEAGWQPGGHLLTLAAERRRPLALSAHSEHPLAGLVEVCAHDDVARDTCIGECLAFPVTTATEVVGAISVARLGASDPYTRGDFQLLSVLAAQAGLLIRNAELVADLERGYVGTVRAMALMLEARDRYTHGHSRRVAHLCARLAQAMQVSPSDAHILEVAASLHDIGKVAVPDDVLNKPGILTEREWVAVRLHPVVGAEVLAPASFLAQARPLVLHHHERADGKGYPDGLKGGQISLLTHMIIAADAWDAMTSHRPYRPPLSTERALREIERCRATQFDPEVADALVELVASAS